MPGMAQQCSTRLLRSRHLPLEAHVCMCPRVRGARLDVSRRHDTAPNNGLQPTRVEGVVIVRHIPNFTQESSSEYEEICIRGKHAILTLCHDTKPSNKTTTHERQHKRIESPPWSLCKSGPESKAETRDEYSSSAVTNRGGAELS